MTKETAGVKRWVPTHVNKDGMRTLSRSAQGRFTFNSENEVRQWIRDITVNTPTETLRDLFGDVTKMEPREVECWPGHHDPKTCWFD